MLTNSLTDGVLSLTPLFLLYSLTFLTFFKVLLTHNIKSTYFDKLKPLNTFSGSFFLCFLMLLNISFIFLISFLYFEKNWSSTFWSSHLIITNYNLFLILFVCTIIGYILYIFYNIFFQQINLYKDYFFAIVKLIFGFPYLFLVNNFFSFIFILEYLNTIIFYKLISSKINKVDSFYKFFNYYPSKKYINIIFFQFWSTFFSNMFFFYFFIYILYKLGSTNWYFINYALSTPLFTLNLEWVQLLFVTIVFVLSVFLKLGSAPLHLFKVEIYDGLPYVSILFYTTFYISVFFLFILYFFSYLCFSLYSFIIYFFVYFVLFGLIYLVFNSIFNVQLLKAFFAYSTLLNIAFFFVVFTVMTV